MAKASREIIIGPRVLRSAIEHSRVVRMALSDLELLEVTAGSEQKLNQR